MPLTSNAEEWLTAYRWPGNVRQLTHLIERVVFCAADPHITADMLDRSAQGAGRA
jgi:DNA-binding NtrC family response regulator